MKKPINTYINRAYVGISHRGCVGRDTSNYPLILSLGLFFRGVHRNSEKIAGESWRSFQECCDQELRIGEVCCLAPVVSVAICVVNVGDDYHKLLAIHRSLQILMSQSGSFSCHNGFERCSRWICFNFVC